LTEKWGNFTRTLKMWQSSITHEFGHAYHYKNRLANDVEISSKVGNFYKNAKAILDKLSKQQSELLDKSNQTASLSALQKEYGNDYTRAEILRYYAVVGDIFAALSVGKIGFGHPESYWDDAIRRFHELFANSTDVYLNGNPILKDKFEELDILIKNFWDNERGI
jgi:hypothetical protein